jgi:uncharacterized protein
MLLDLSEIVTREGMRSDLDIDQPGVEDPDLVFGAPLRGHLTFLNSGDLLNIDGQVETTLVIPCSRCLTEVRVPSRIEVEEHFPIDDVLHPNRPPEQGAEYDTTVSSVVYLEQGRPIMDLDELLRQLIVSEVPIQTLCREDCAGLCQRCGANLNQGPCGCPEEPLNTPLAALASLLKDGALEEK